MATVTAAVTATAPPTVEVLASGLPFTIGNKITLYRDQEGRRAAVRGVLGVALTGTDGAWVDYEAAFGIDVTYTVEVRSSAGALLATVAAAPVVMDIDVPWISDPLDPNTATPVLPEFDTLREWTQDRDGDTLPVQSDDLYVGVTGIMHAPAGFPLAFICLSADQVNAVMRVIRQASPFLWRSPPGRPGGRAWYVVAKQVKQVNHDWVPDRPVTVVISMTATQVRAPGATVAVPVRTYSMLPAEASTYGQQPSVYVPPTYLSILRGRTA